MKRVSKKKVVEEVDPIVPQELHKKSSVKNLLSVDSLSSPVQTMGLQRNYGFILILLLIVAAYLLGMLTTKVQYLEKGTAMGTGATGGTQPAAAAAAAQPAAAQQGLQTGQKVTVAVGHLPAKGDANAKVKIIEFEDLRCPFCKNYTLTTEPQIIKDYVNTGKAVLYFRQYPFLGAASTTAANAAECANEQGKFWEFHDYMYTNQPDEADTTMFTTDKLTSIATGLGMDGTQFSSCLSSNKDAQLAAADLSDGQKAGVQGTPTIFINGNPIVGAQDYSAFKTVIEQELNK